MSCRVRAILAICCFGIVLKLTLVAFGIDEFYDYEELARGLTAHEILNGPVYPIFNYQIDNYSGGSLVMGILAVPFFAVFGENLFVLKLTAIIFPLLTSIFIYLVIYRYIDRHAALLAAILVFLAPYSYTRLSLVVWGDHPQMPALMAAVFFLLYEVTFGMRRRPLFITLFGIICGFGLYFSYHFLAPLVLCILFIFAWNRKFLFSYNLIYFILGFVIGFSPWIYFNVTHDFQGLTISWYGSTFDIPRSVNLQNVFKRFFQLVTDVLGYSLGTNLVLNSTQKKISLLYYFVFLVSFGTLVAKNRVIIGDFFNAFILPQRMQKKLNRNWQEIPFLLYMPIFILFIVFAPFSLKNWPNYFADRYFTTLHTCMFIIIAIAVMVMLRKQVIKKILAMGMTGVVLLNGIFTQAGIISRGVHNRNIEGCFKKVIEQKGFSDEFLMDDRIAYAWYRGNLSENLDVIAKSKDKQSRYYLSMALGRSLAYYARDKLFSVIELLNQTSFPDDTVKNFIYAGLGYGRGRWYSKYLKIDLMLIKNFLWFHYFLDGLNDSVVFWFNKDTAKAAEFIKESIPDYFKNKFFYQLGVGIALKRKGILSDCIKDMTSNIPSPYLGDVYAGMGKKIKEYLVNNLDDKSKLIKFIKEKVAPEHQKSLIYTIFEMNDNF